MVLQPNTKILFVDHKSLLLESIYRSSLFFVSFYIYWQGTRKVAALHFEFTKRKWGSRPNYFVGEDFEQVQNLRFLNVINADLNGDFEHVLSNLRYLQWQRCSGKFTPTNFNLKNLVTLDLSGSEITNEWVGWCEIKVSI